MICNIIQKNKQINIVAPYVEQAVPSQEYCTTMSECQPKKAPYEATDS